MKKYLIALITTACFSAQLKAQVTMAYKKVPTDTNIIVYDGQGNALHYYQYRKLVNSGDYTIRYNGRPGEPGVQGHLKKLTDADREQMLAIVKERLSIKSDKLKIGNVLDMKPLENDLHGVNITNKVIMLIFWDANCQPCNENIDALSSVFSQLPDPQNIVLIVITTDYKDAAVAKLKESTLLNIQSITNSGKLYTYYGMTTTTGYVVADKDHIIRFTLAGISPVTLIAIKTAVTSALAQ